MKRKGKIHPSPLPQPTAASSSSSSLQHTSAGHDSLSVLNLLPAAILALAAFLSLQDREVLAFMITRSLKIPTTSSINSASSIKESKKFYRPSSNSQLLLLLHKPPVFDCECFDCYISYWFRWDSSPNRELIHQAIEAFEEHLANGEVKVKASSSICNNRRGRKKKFEKQTQIPDPIMKQFPVDETQPEPEKVDEVKLTPVAEEEEKTGHKGYARRVLADILGVLKSRLWNLWG